MTQKHILILAHSENPPLKALLPILDTLGHAHTITRMPFGEVPPEPATVDGLIILGAPASVHQADTLNWIQAEMDWVKSYMALKRPIFGICFGCQMMAELLGGKCFAGDNGREFSYVDISLVKDDALFDAATLAKLPVFQAHGDTYSLPEGATHLLAGEIYAQQGAKFADNWYGVQFHPEISAEVAGRWHRFALENGRWFGDDFPTLEEHMALTEKNQKPIHAWLEGFLGRLFA